MCRLFLNITFVFLTLQMFSSCRKLVEVAPPVTSITSGNVFADEASAAAVLTGIYADLGNNNPLTVSSINGISLATALSADELTLHGGSANANVKLVEYYTNRVTGGLPNSSVSSIWNDCYAKLYIVNLAIERLNISMSLTPSVKKQLLGEAKFLRAFLYFYLVNLFGDVPLTVTSDYRVNIDLSRSSQAKVYEQIIADLKEAQALLSKNYVGADAKSSTSERVRPNKWAATALLARTYLYSKDWANAEAQATDVINNIPLYDTVSVNNVFLKNSKEAIWQLQPVNKGWNTEDARIFILPPTGPTSSSNAGYPVYVSTQLLSCFEPGDQRRINWLNNVVVPSSGSIYYYPFKYKSATQNDPVTEYVMVLRLAEQYLIRAEARAEQNSINQAQDDLNTIRARAGLDETTAGDLLSLRDAIQRERRVELFTEWGQRWLDLKRSGNINAIMSALATAKGTTWNPNWQWYPIPLYDITQNPNLQQNQGY